LDPGAASLVIRVRERFRESPEFWLQGVAEDGAATYIASAKGYSEATGTVKLTKSAIIVTGPFKAPAYRTTTAAPVIKLTLTAGRLDASSKFVEEQLLAVQP